MPAMPVIYVNLSMRRLYSVLLANQIIVIVNEICVYTSKFTNVLSRYESVRCSSMQMQYGDVYFMQYILVIRSLYLH